MFPALHRSRPRFWIYLLGPYLLGWTAASPLLARHPVDWLPFCLGLLFFTLPANLFIYGINDLHDEATDRLNPKKQGYEDAITDQARSALRRAIPLVLAVAVGFVLGIGILTRSGVQTIEAAVGMLGLFFLGWQYSAPPCRAKARPFWDSAFNGLYLFPGLVGHALANTAERLPNPLLIAAAWSWCAAMHAFSAIPDITADREAGVATVATRLGKQKTLPGCGVLYATAGILAGTAPELRWVAIVATPAYLSLLWLAARAGSEERLFRIYTWFPWLNTGVGFLLWTAVVH